MDQFYQMFLGIIFLFFPLNIYLIYVAHNKMISVKENDLFFGFSCFFSLYLILCINFNNLTPVSFMFINIPIYIAYLRGKYKEAILLSFLAMYFKFEILNSISIILFIEYIGYFLLYLTKVKIKFNSYIFIITVALFKSIIFVFDYFYTNVHSFSKFGVMDFLIMVPVVVIITSISHYIFNMGDDIMKYHMSYRELKHESQIRSSLFKITHEIKNPLAVCKGYLSMLDVNNLEQCKKYIPIIDDEIKRTLLILQDFSSIAKIKIEKDLMDINFLISETIKILDPLLIKNSIKIYYKEESEIFINGDYDRLVQVFLNILKNSIEALTEKENKKIKISTQVYKNNVTILIEDNGIGMSKYTLEHIEDPFYTTKKDGTGLGTVFSSEIIKEHNGSIQYISEEGKGTITKVKIKVK